MYRTRNPDLQAVYKACIYGNVKACGCACENAYRVAFETGSIPKWCSDNTRVYAAARAGLDNRKCVRS